MVVINPSISIPMRDISCSAIHASGNGGQNVNKVATAIHLRFDIHASSLNEQQKLQLLNFADTRITQSGVVVIKSQEFRTQEQNRQAAIERLIELINTATFTAKRRKATRPTLASKRRRLNNKKQNGNTKQLRSKVRW